MRLVLHIVLLLQLVVGLVARAEVPTPSHGESPASETAPGTDAATGPATEEDALKEAQKKIDEIAGFAQQLIDDPKSAGKLLATAEETREALDALKAKVSPEDAAKLEESPEYKDMVKLLEARQGLTTAKTEAERDAALKVFAEIAGTKLGAKAGVEMVKALNAFATPGAKLSERIGEGAQTGGKEFTKLVVKGADFLSGAGKMMTDFWDGKPAEEVLKENLAAARVTDEELQALGSTVQAVSAASSPLLGSSVSLAGSALGIGVGGLSKYAVPAGSIEPQSLGGVAGPSHPGPPAGFSGGQFTGSAQGAATGAGIASTGESASAGAVSGATGSSASATSGAGTGVAVAPPVTGTTSPVSGVAPVTPSGAGALVSSAVSGGVEGSTGATGQHGFASAGTAGAGAASAAPGGSPAPKKPSLPMSSSTADSVDAAETRVAGSGEGQAPNTGALPRGIATVRAPTNSSSGFSTSIVASSSNTNSVSPTATAAGGTAASSPSSVALPSASNPASNEPTVAGSEGVVSLRGRDGAGTGSTESRLVTSATEVSAKVPAAAANKKVVASSESSASGSGWVPSSSSANLSGADSSELEALRKENKRLLAQQQGRGAKGTRGFNTVATGSEESAAESFSGGTDADEGYASLTPTRGQPSEVSSIQLKQPLAKPSSASAQFAAAQANAKQKLANRLGQLDAARAMVGKRGVASKASRELALSGVGASGTAHNSPLAGGAGKGLRGFTSAVAKTVQKGKTSKPLVPQRSSLSR